MTAIRLEHAGPWTEEEYLALPETRQQIELLDGTLLVSPGPASDHQQLARRLANLLEDAAPDELEVVEGINLRVAPGKILIPDVVVTPRRGRVKILNPEDIVLVVEVVSPSTTTKDQVLKSHLYGTAGIPWYLQVDPETPKPPALGLYELAGTLYVERAHICAGETLPLPPPLIGTLDPSTLLKRRH